MDTDFAMKITDETTDDVSYWSTKDVAKTFPQIWGKKRTGETFVRKFVSSGLIKKHNLDNVFQSFEKQDLLKNFYRTQEIAGHDARFYVTLWDGSEVVFSKIVSDWFLQNSMIAQLIRKGWQVSVK